MDIPNSDTYEGNTYSVKSLGNFCSVCCSLTSIAIPESVTSLGNSCFQGCSSQKSVTCELSKPIENGGLFYNTPISNAVFHVPASGSSSAKAVRMSFDDDAITEILLLEGENTEETAKTPVYDLNGMQKSGISKGWNIVNGKKIQIKLHSTLALPTAPNLSNSETNVFFASNENIF